MNRHTARSAGFRPSPATGPVTQLSRRQALALLTGLVVAFAGIAVAAVLVKPTKARSFDLFRGSVFLSDDRAPVAVDLTTGKPTVRLLNAYAQVNASSETDLQVLPLSTGTLLLNKTTSEFNVVDTAGYVVKTTGGGVPLPKVAGQSGTQAIASGTSAFIEQSGPTSTTVYLVSQSTVEAARASTAKVRPRAVTTLDQTSTSGPATAAAANGDLWLLTGGGGSAAGGPPTGSLTVHQLRVPAGSANGAELTDTPHGQLGAVAAIASTSDRDSSSTDDQTGGDVVAVAAPGQITLYSPNSDSDGTYDARTLPLDGLGSADQILAATGETGHLAFLIHTGSGWSVASVDVTGGVNGQTKLVQQKLSETVGAGANLVSPVLSRDTLYTMDRNTAGTLLQVDPATGGAATIEGMKTYPLVTNSAGQAQESTDFADTYLFTRGDRVIANSPNHRMAIILFTDGTSGPVGIDKSTAVDLNAAGGAAAITDTRTEEQKQQQAQQQPANQASPTPQIAAPVPQINNAAQCATTTQIPHIPTITGATPASRSVALVWTYPLLDTQDCAPSTYTVAVQLVSGSAPAPPAAVTVQGQSGVNLTGLFPDSRYQAVVTAYINGRGTASQPIPFTTGREGPAAPLGVHATTDASGNWSVAWSTCGTAAAGCVQSASWTVTASFCDGVGLSGPPTPVTITGDPTLSQFSATFPGGGGLLGRGLSFQVQGVGVEGDVGAAGTSGDCVYSWGPINAAAFTLSASTPPPVSFGASTTSTFSVAVSDLVQASGGIGAQFTYRLLNPDGSEVSRMGPTSQLSATFTGLAAGKTYQGAVTVTPPPHSPTQPVNVGPVTITAATSAWPALTIAPTVVDAGNINATITLKINGVSSSQANGEQFTLTGASLSCGGGSTTTPLSYSPAFDPSSVSPTFTVSRLSYSGPCTVTGVVLNEVGGKYFGGTPSAAVSAPVNIDAPGYAGTANDFKAVFNDDGDVVVTYIGGDPAYSVYRDFNFTVSRTPNGSGTAKTCGSLTPISLLGNPTTFTVNVNAGSGCQDIAGQSAGNWDLAVTYTFTGSTKSYAGIDITGTPPTFTPTPTPEPVTPSPSPTPTQRVTPTPRITASPVPSATPN